jgi:sec-independent protein translocase protein TatA
MSGQELVLVLLAVLLLFGSKKIPEFAKGLGKGLREFRKATDDIKREINDGIQDIHKDVDDLKKNIHD